MAINGTKLTLLQGCEISSNILRAEQRFLKPMKQPSLEEAYRINTIQEMVVGLSKPDLEHFHDFLLPTRVFSRIGYCLFCNGIMDAGLFEDYLKMALKMIRKLLWADYTIGYGVSTKWPLTYSTENVGRIAARIQEYFPFTEISNTDDIRSMFNDNGRYERLLYRIREDEKQTPVTVVQAMFGNHYCNGIFKKIIPAVEINCRVIG